MNQKIAELEKTHHFRWVRNTFCYLPSIQFQRDAPYYRDQTYEENYNRIRPIFIKRFGFKGDGNREITDEEMDFETVMYALMSVSF